MLMEKALAEALISSSSSSGMVNIFDAPTETTETTKDEGSKWLEASIAAGFANRIWVSIIVVDLIVRIRQTVATMKAVALMP
ncbi:hypothetical protein P3342_006783 [Pyrenophora teres f. teres]|nr:hypothetical protein P3342_006783 [Pyrenophora teres f. teres]